jgi:hypothetical protein
VISPLEAFDSCWLVLAGVLSCARRKQPESIRTNQNFLIEILLSQDWDESAIAPVAINLCVRETYLT